MTVEAFAPAKVNLTLHVTGKRADGYHLLDSLVVFADVGDRLSLTPANAMSVAVTGPFAEGVPAGPENLVWQAAESAGWSGRIKLEKNIPHGAGLGGGSADAAAVLRSLRGDQVAEGIGLETALKLGADVPVCLHAGPQRVQGIGERLSRVWPVPQLHLVLVNPGVVVPTASVFGALSDTQNPLMEDVSGWGDWQSFCDWLSRQRNDLQPPAMAIAPAISEVLASLEGARLARMSGSGSTCFGIFEDMAQADAAARRIAAAQPGWWVRSAATAGALS